MRPFHPSLSLALLLGAACAPTPPVPTTPSAAHVERAPYRVVHIDTLAPDKAASFEDARRAFVEELHRVHASDKRGLFIRVEGKGFYSLRSLSHFAELDTRAEEVEAAMKGVSKEAGDRYDQGSDTALVFPHASEVWRRDDDFAYAPPGAAPLTEETAACGRLVLEDVRPDPASGGRYDAAWADMKRALAAVRYPLTRVTYHSFYGAGHLVTMWLAPSKEALEAAPSPEAALAKALGDAKAAELVAARDASVEHVETHGFTIRQDLSSF